MGREQTLGWDDVRENATERQGEQGPLTCSNPCLQILGDGLVIWKVSDNTLRLKYLYQENAVWSSRQCHPEGGIVKVHLGLSHIFMVPTPPRAVPLPFMFVI